MDLSLLKNQGYNSLHEKSALQQLKRYLISGGPLPTYFNEVIKGLKIKQEDGTYRAPKKIAEAMGHEYETHLLSYARFDSKDLAKSFDQVPT